MSYYDKENASVWPCTVVFDRYGGSYSGGVWTAWNLESNDVPYEIHSDNVTVHRFFLYASEKPVYGRGKTAQEAVNDLTHKILNGIKNRDIVCHVTIDGEGKPI